MPTYGNNRTVRSRLSKKTYVHLFFKINRVVGTLIMINSYVHVHSVFGRRKILCLILHLEINKKLFILFYTTTKNHFFLLVVFETKRLNIILALRKNYKYFYWTIKKWKPKWHSKVKINAKWYVSLTAHHERLWQLFIEARVTTPEQEAWT